MTQYLIDMPCSLRNLVSSRGHEFSKLNIFTGDTSSAADEIYEVVQKIKPGAFLDPDNIVRNIEDVISRISVVRKCAELFSTDPKYFYDRWVILTYPEAFLHPMRQIEVAQQIAELANVPGVSIVLFTHSPTIHGFLEAAIIAGAMAADDRLEKIIPSSLRLRKEDCKAWDVQGYIWTCFDFSMAEDRHLPFMGPANYLSKIRGGLITIAIEDEDRQDERA